MKRVLVGFWLVVYIAVFSVGICMNTGSVYAQADSQLNARLEERRSRFKSIKLNAQDKTKFVARCGAAQTKLTDFAKKANDQLTQVQTKQDNYLKKLQDLSAALKSKGKDTSELDSQIAVLAQKYQDYKASADKLTTALGDLKTINCTAEPNGFKSTLEDARQQLKAAKSSRKEIADFHFRKAMIIEILAHGPAKSTILPVLQKIKSDNSTAATGSNP